MNDQTAILFDRARSFLKEMILNGEGPYETRKEMLRLWRDMADDADRLVKEADKSLADKALLDTGGCPLDISPVNVSEIRDLVADGAWIQAIKVIRSSTGLGLRDAKDIYHYNFPKED